MGKTTGFIDYGREDMKKEPVHLRIAHNKEFEKPLHDPRVQTQAARCMDCGIPYCNWGCPVDNLIPEFNDLVGNGQWLDAYITLTATNNFPEFTGRICPAPCEPACCAAIVETPIAIKHIELAIIEKAFKHGWVKPHVIDKNKRTGVNIAVVGSGPAGLAAAQQLNLHGHTVTVLEKQDRFGGLLTYGIPDFKLEKWVVDRRIKLLEQEGITFKANTAVGENYPVDRLLSEFDFSVLCCGAEDARDIDLPGRNKKGIRYAMDYLTQHNRRNFGDAVSSEACIDAKGKHVIVIGGGDTGSDCVGTGIRQGCKSMTQVQLHKEPPPVRWETNPWPEPPRIYADSSSQMEGCERKFALLAKEVKGDDRIKEVEFYQLKWPTGETKSGQRDYAYQKKTVMLPCDLLLIALGFKHTYHNRLITDLNLETDAHGNVKIDEGFKTSADNIFACGDMTEGANLVVTAIAAGRKAAASLNRHANKIKRNDNQM